MTRWMLASFTFLLSLPFAAQSAVIDIGQVGTEAGDSTPGSSIAIQTAYSASYFGATPLTINSLSFFLYAANPVTENFTITLSTSKNRAGDLSSDMAANVGSDAETFYSGAPDFVGAKGWYTFSGTPFSYDPSAGDLLVEIDHATNVPMSSGYTQVSTDGQRAYEFDDGSVHVDGLNYVFAIQINASPAAVPETATWMTAIGGFGLVGASTRRSRKGATRLT